MKLPEPIAEWVRCAAHGAQHDVREIIADMQTAPVQEPVHKLIYPGGGKALFNRLWHLTCNAVATQSGMRVRTDVMPMREMKEFLDHLCVLVDSPPQPVPAPVQEPTRFDLDMDGSMEPSEFGQWVRYGGPSRMITLHSRTSSGHTTHHVAAPNIARISEAGTSSQWHGIRAIVKLFDGGVLEVEETASAIRAMVDKEAT